MYLFVFCFFLKHRFLWLCNDIDGFCEKWLVNFLLSDNLFLNKTWISNYLLIIMYLIEHYLFNFQLISLGKKQWKSLHDIIFATPIICQVQR